MRLPLTALATLILLAPAAAVSPPDAAVSAQLQRYIVGFHEPSGLQPGDSYAGDRVVEVDDVLRFAVVETRDPDALRLRAALDDNARYVEWDDPHYGRALYTPNDPLYNNAGHWGTKKINAHLAWDVTLGSTAVKVAVIDSGLRRTHEEFAGQARILNGWDAIDGDTNPQDTCGHGTHVTGTIAATINNGKGIAGLAQVTVFPIRGLTSSILDCTGSVTDLAEGLRRAGDEGAHLSSNSWGGGGSSTISNAIAYAHGKGVTHVAAAGNDGSCTNCVNEPWRANEARVIIVSSTTSSDGFSSFSSQGPQIDVSAPGSSIISSYSSNDASYATLSGTSMAAPHVTGTAALIKSVHPTWGYNDIDNQLKTTAVDLGAAGKDDRFGYGRINAYAAVSGGGPAPNTPPTACFARSGSTGTVAVDGTCSSDADGVIASWSWDWGDGSPAGSGSTASHAYAAAGTYTITLTVTDDDGATATTSQTFTISADPDPSTPTISNGAVNSFTSGAAGTDQYYKMWVPTGRTVLRATMDGPACGTPLPCTPDLDLSIRQGARPTDTEFACSAAVLGSDEECAATNPASDWWYVRVHVTAGSNAPYTLRLVYV